jgi:MoxR-like ATPase
MKKEIQILRPQIQLDGTLNAIDINGDTFNDVRYHILQLAYDNNQCIERNTNTGKCYRKPIDLYTLALQDCVDPKELELEVESSEKIDADPILAFIHSSPDLIPNTIKITDLKWKYLMRSAVRAKNIMMTGPAGCGKTMAAKKVVEVLNRPHFYFNLGATQDPRSTLIGNTHFKKEEGTSFSQSAFVKAIQTKDAIILLDELSRAHPEAWNILMTVLDYGQRYLRLDEQEDSPTIPVAEGVTFIATANIGNEYTATRSMDRALVDRFTIIEMDTLTKEQESGLLKDLHPGITKHQADTIAEIASLTRKELNNESPKLTNSISTRLSVEIAGLLEDGFTLPEAAETCIYPFFDNDGGVDSERTYMKQLVQKYIGSESQEELFETEVAPESDQGSY